MAGRSRGLGAGVAVATGAVFALPFVYLIVRAPAFGDAWEALANRRTTDPLGRSLILGLVVSCLSTALGVTLSLLVTRANIRARRTVRTLLILPLVVPSFVAAHAFVSAFAPGGLLEQAFGWSGLPEVRGFRGAVFVLTLLTYPYVMLTVTPQLAALPPSLEEVGRLLGRSPRQVFTSIVWPQIANAVIAGASLVFLYSISDFGAVSFVRYDTLSRAIFESRLDPTRSVMYSAVLAVIALLAASVVHFARQRRPTMTTGAARGSMSYDLGRWRAMVHAGVWLVITVALLIPVGVITWWVIRGRRSGGRRSVAVNLTDSAMTSSWLAVVAAVVTVAMVIPLAALLSRRPTRSASVASIIVNAAFALPGVVIGLSLVRQFVGTPLYQTYPLLILAYALHFGGQALGAVTVAFDSVPRRLGEAARMLGAGGIRRWRRVEMPLLLPGWSAAAGLILLSVLKELPATLMLRPIGSETLATRIQRTAEDALLIDAGQLSLVLVAVSAILSIQTLRRT
jgi:iron(III) transport system permease protein